MTTTTTSLASENSYNFKPDAGSKYIRLKERSAISHSKKNGKSALAINTENALLCLGERRLLVKHQFYMNNQKFLKGAAKQLDLIINHIEQLNGLFLSEEEAISPLADFLDLLEGAIIPVTCVLVADFEIAKKLSELRELITLLRKHAEDLPTGEEALEKAENDFEELCALHRIGRRTRKIIQSTEVKI